MIYLQITHDVQLLSIPRAEGYQRENAGEMVLALEKGGQVITFPGLVDADANTMYFLFEIEDSTRLVTGEYNYTLTDGDGNVQGAGILTAGEYVRTVETIPGERKIIEYAGR